MYTWSFVPRIHTLPQMAMSFTVVGTDTVCHCCDWAALAVAMIDTATTAVSQKMRLMVALPWFSREPALITERQPRNGLMAVRRTRRIGLPNCV